MHTLKFFHDAIIQHGGLIVSEATHREIDLLENFLAYVRPIKGYARKAQKLLSEGKALLATQERIEERCRRKGWPMPWTPYYTGCDEKWNEQREAWERVTSELSYLVNEDLFDLMNEIAPEGYWFSSHEGDGACFGFWTDEAEHCSECDDACDELESTYCGSFCPECLADHYERCGVCGEGEGY